MRKSGNHYIFPAYFEAHRSRHAGRRVPKRLALTVVSTSMIAQAAQRLGLEYSVESKVRYPASWWSTPGVVLIKKTDGQTKTQLLQELAKIMNTLKTVSTK